MEHTIVAGDSKRSVVNMLVARSDCDVWPQGLRKISRWVR